MAEEQMVQNVSDWNEDSLCNAYQNGLNIVEGKERSSRKESRRRKWKIGDYCRAIYSADDQYYEAKVIYAYGDFCKVKFLGYGNLQNAEQKDLIESRGREARYAQIEESCAYVADESEDTTDESVAGDRSCQQHHENQPSTVPSAAAYHAPSSPMPANLPFMLPPRSIPECPWHPSPPIAPQYSGVTTTDPAVSSMLTAWYMAGYYTGIFCAGKGNHGCQCCCNHSYRCPHN